MAASKYDEQSEMLITGNEDEPGEYGPNGCPRQSRSKLPKVIYGLTALLALSIASNIILAVQIHTPGSPIPFKSIVGLQWDVETTIHRDDRPADDPMWDSPEFEFNIGVIALEASFAKEKGILSAQKYPWDKSKEIYLLSAFHSLHCVNVLRETLLELQGGKSLKWGFEHATHCLHVLRQDIVCFADDLPRYTGAIHAENGHNNPSSGTGQVRICRNWDKLLKFAKEHSACYNNPTDRYIPLLDRYKSCPDGSRPWEGLNSSF